MNLSLNKNKGVTDLESNLDSMEQIFIRPVSLKRGSSIAKLNSASTPMTSMSKDKILLESSLRDGIEKITEIDIIDEMFIELLDKLNVPKSKVESMTKLLTMTEKKSHIKIGLSVLDDDTGFSTADEDMLTVLDSQVK
jgi:hypothetical protein